MISANIFGSNTRMAIAEVASPFEFSIFVMDGLDQKMVIRLFLDAGKYRTSSDATIDESVFLRNNYVTDVLGAVEAAKESLHEFIHADVGPYPFARIWMMNHLNINTKKVQIPGWAWKAFREHPDHQGKIASSTTYELVDKGSNKMAPKTVTRKITTVKPEIKKPPKKPKCPLHHVEMKFDPLRGAWWCETDGCKQIALPKRERIEGQLLLGKGKIQMRIAYPDKGEDPRLILISDDNVALDITELCTDPVQEMMEVEGIDDLLADAHGVPEIAFKRFVATIKSSGLVMGVENAP